MNLKSQFLKKIFNYQKFQSDEVKIIIQFYATPSLKLLTSVTQWLVWSLKGEDVFFMPPVPLAMALSHKLALLVSIHILTCACLIF